MALRKGSEMATPPAPRRTVRRESLLSFLMRASVRLPVEKRVGLGERHNQLTQVEMRTGEAGVEPLQGAQVVGGGVAAVAVPEPLLAVALHHLVALAQLVGQL